MIINLFEGVTSSTKQPVNEEPTTTDKDIGLVPPPPEHPSTVSESPLPSSDQMSVSNTVPNIKEPETTNLEDMDFPIQSTPTTTGIDTLAGSSFYASDPYLRDWSAEPFSASLTILSLFDTVGEQLEPSSHIGFGLETEEKTFPSNTRDSTSEIYQSVEVYDRSIEPTGILLSLYNSDDSTSIDDSTRKIHQSTEVYNQSIQPTDTSLYTSDHSSLSSLCECPCSDYDSVYTTKSVLEDYDRIKERIITIKKDLKIERKDTSRYKRMHFSAFDDRLSAKSIGMVGVIILCIAFGSILIFDIPIFLKRLL